MNAQHLVLDPHPPPKVYPAMKIAREQREAAMGYFRAMARQGRQRIAYAELHSYLTIETGRNEVFVWPQRRRVIDIWSRFG